MNPHVTTLALSLVTVVTLVVAGGCADQKPAAEPAAVEISSAEAVHAARRDAAYRFRLTDVSAVAVSRAGRYWVVDLRANDGAGIHYAIAHDGSIRERRTMR